MVAQAFFEKVWRPEFPNDKDKTVCEAMIRFINEDVTEENINSSCYRGMSTFCAILMIIGQEKLEKSTVASIIDALLEKKPEIDQNALFMVMKSDPVTLDMFLKKIHPQEKEKLFSERTLLSSKEIKRSFFVAPENIRILINHGLSSEKFISDFKFDDNISKALMSSISTDFATPTNVDNTEYREFYDSELVKMRQEIVRRIRLALVFPSTAEKLSTLGNISFERDGADYGVMFNYLQEIFRNYSSFSGKAIENKVLKEYFLDPIERKIIFEETSEILLGNSKDGNRIIPITTIRSSFATGNENHAEGLLIFDDLLMKINRGLRESNQQSGITIFQKSSATSETEATAYFSTLNMHESVNGCEFDTRIKSMVLPTPLLILSMKDQKTGNCTLATSKAFVQAIYFAVIRKHLKKHHPGEDEDSINKKASSIAKSMYKDFSMTHRIQEIKKYIAIHVKDNFKSADKEILIKMITYAFKLKDIEIIEQVKGNQALYSFIKNESLRFLINAAGQDDLDFIRFILNHGHKALDKKILAEILTAAIKENALEIISNFETLFGSLKDIKVYDAFHPLTYSIMTGCNADTVLNLLKKYSPTPYQEIIKGLKSLQSLFKEVPGKKNDITCRSIETVQKFCCDKLIQESRNEASTILEKKIDSKKKIEEITAFYDTQKAILKELTIELPNAEEYEKILKAMIDATVTAARQCNTAVLTNYKQPEVIKPTHEDSESNTVTIHKIENKPDKPD